MKKTGVFSKVYIGLVLFFFYLPMIIVVAYSFNTAKSGAAWTGFTLDWYAEMAADSRLIDALLISLRVAFVTSAISAVIGTAGAISVSRLPAGKKRAANLAMYIPLIVPEIVMGVALLMFFSITPLKYGVTTLILSHTTFCVPYVFILAGIRLRSIDPALHEAAADLGARPLKAFFTVTLPLIAPAVLSGALLAMAMSLDDVVISNFVSGPESVTLPMRVFSMLKIGVTPKINALSTIVLFLTFLTVGLLQAHTSMKAVLPNAEKDIIMNHTNNGTTIKNKKRKGTH